MSTDSSHESLGLTAWRPTRRALLRNALVGLAAGGAFAALAPRHGAAQEFEPYWVQSYAPTELWSGPNAAADSFGPISQGTYLRVVEPQSGARLHVWNPVVDNYAYVDASTVGPVPPPPPEAIARRTTLWVGTDRATTLWSDVGTQALPLGQIGPFETFEVLASDGARLRVRDPLAGEIAYLDRSAVGPIGAPQLPMVPSVRWRGTVGPGINLRAGANTQSAALGQLGQKVPLVVARWVAGEEVFPDQPAWGQLADGAFIYSALLRPAPLDAPPRVPANAPASGRWIDVNLTHQVAVAYQDRTVMYRARFSSGRPSWETSTGVFPILRRVEKETMDSASLLGLDASRANYRVEDIKWTQYFTNDGQAIHHNYWRDPALFGIPSSHGCLGMVEPDAKWLWDWATVGTPLVIHYEATG
jgi:hypothetical protein